MLKTRRLRRSGRPGERLTARAVDPILLSAHCPPLSRLLRLAVHGPRTTWVVPGVLAAQCPMSLRLIGFLSTLRFFLPSPFCGARGSGKREAEWSDDGQPRCPGPRPRRLVSRAAAPDSPATESERCCAAARRRRPGAVDPGSGASGRAPAQ